MSVANEWNGYKCHTVNYDPAHCPLPFNTLADSNIYDLYDSAYFGFKV